MTRSLHVVDATDHGALLRALRQALTADGPAVLPRDPSTAEPSSLSGGLPTGDLGGPPTEVAQNVALVIETSGSTGVPKRVAISRDALLASAAATESALGGPGQWLLALPAHYIAGVQVLVRSLTAGTEPVVLPVRRFETAVFAQHAAHLDGDLRFVSLVPVQLARLLDAAGSDRALAGLLRRFDAILVGGQALRADLRERALDLGLAVRATYGMSETCGGCVYDGRPIGNTHVRVVDGELQLAGSVLAEGYLGEPDRTAAGFIDAEGTRWYRTGDLGEVVDDVVRVTGRRDNVIVSGGTNVSLDAVQQRVRTLPGMADAVVVAADSEEWGQVPVVVVEGAAPVTLETLRATVVEVLGRAAAPARLVVVERMPHLPSGKPDLRALAAMARPGTSHTS